MKSKVAKFIEDSQELENVEVTGSKRYYTKQWGRMIDVYFTSEGSSTAKRTSFTQAHYYELTGELV